MSEAVVVNKATKKFGSPGGLLWKRLPRLSGKASGKANSEAAYQEYNPYVVALDRVSFAIQQGEIFGVLGGSGSGKSTLIRLIATLLLPDDGDIQVFGYDVANQPMQVQRLINPVSVQASFFRRLSPVENLVYGARLNEMSASEIRHQAVEMLTRLGLEQHSIYEPMEKMPPQLQQKVAIARPLLSRPRLLLLDEPTRGLDLRSKRAVQDVIRELRDEHGTTILLTTQDMLEAQNLCDRVAIINAGKIMALDTSAGLKRRIVRLGPAVTLEEMFLDLVGKTPAREEVVT